MSHTYLKKVVIVTACSMANSTIINQPMTELPCLLINESLHGDVEPPLKSLHGSRGACHVISEDLSRVSKFY